MPDFADVDGCIICIQVCMWLGFPPLSMLIKMGSYLYTLVQMLLLFVLEVAPLRLFQGIDNQEASVKSLLCLFFQESLSDEVDLILTLETGNISYPLDWPGCCQ